MATDNTLSYACNIINLHRTDVTIKAFLLQPRSGVKYCNQRTSVCLSAHIAQKAHVQTSWTFCTLHVAMAQSSSDDNAIRYAPPVLWMTSRFHIIGHIWRQLHPSMLPPTDWHPLDSPLHNGVWLLRRTMHYTHGASLLSLAASIFCMLYFQWAARSTFQTCILNLH